MRSVLYSTPLLPHISSGWLYPLSRHAAPNGIIGVEFYEIWIFLENRKISTWELRNLVGGMRFTHGDIAQER